MSDSHSQGVCRRNDSQLVAIGVTEYGIEPSDRLETVEEGTIVPGVDWKARARRKMISVRSKELSANQCAYRYRSMQRAWQRPAFAFRGLSTMSWRPVVTQNHSYSQRAPSRSRSGAILWLTLFRSVEKCWPWGTVAMMIEVEQRAVWNGIGGGLGVRR